MHVVQFEYCLFKHHVLTGGTAGLKMATLSVYVYMNSGDSHDMLCEDVTPAYKWHTVEKEAAAVSSRQ
jgi:hypothetical protein